MLREGDQGAARAEDSGLFAGDLGDGVAEIVLVIEGDVGDDRDQRFDDVGGIETAAHADLEDGDIDGMSSICLLSGKVQETEGRDGLEEAGGVRQGAFANEALSSVVDAEVEAGEVFVGDLDAVDPDALVDSGEVGGGVEAGAVSGGVEDAGEGSGGGALAVGSGDENRREGGLRVAEGCSKDAHVGEVELTPGGVGGWRSELVAQGVEMIDRCAVRHAAILGEGVGLGRFLRCAELEFWTGMPLKFGASPKGGISRVVRASDSRESTVATCNVLQLHCRFNPRDRCKTQGERRRLNAYRVRYLVWNDCRCAVCWTVEG